jgi:hypothetical protein
MVSISATRASKSAIAFVALDLGAVPCLHHVADVADEFVGRMRAGAPVWAAWAAERLK